jgi:hypothetical protein
MNKEYESPNKKRLKVQEVKPIEPLFKNVQSDLGIMPGTIGLLLNMHSVILANDIIDMPEGMVVNKNNTATCGSITYDVFRLSQKRPIVSAEELALRLTRDLTPCGTFDQLMEDIEEHGNFYSDEKDRLMYIVDEHTPHQQLPNSRFKGACSTIFDLTQAMNKTYETKPTEHDNSPPECMLAFAGIVVNLLEEGLDGFLTKFRIRRETLTPKYIGFLSDVFDMIDEGKFDTYLICTLLIFLRDVFHANQVNIFDTGCAEIFDTDKQQYLYKREADREYDELRKKNPKLGFGGTKRKKKKTKKTKRNILKHLNRPN